MTSTIRVLLIVIIGLAPHNFMAKPSTVHPAPPQPNIDIKGSYAADKTQRGRVVRATIAMDIPGGYHVNANKPLGKYAVPTTIKIEAPEGVTVGQIMYPRALVRTLKAVNNERLAVYEGRALFRFNVTIPATYGDGWMNLRAHVRYQSCNDDVCFPPRTQDIDFGIKVVRAGDRESRAGEVLFGDR
ncbi:MAG TPA: protein-disulfide reductase DsbD N-terminal domain-containing protein [Pyrinomonadaceae bacterium]|nr:protein-disulfide reductase DsbD N-terminal domain-containing protein [Pyrinomonadaceae bacterium]